DAMKPPRKAPGKQCASDERGKGKAPDAPGPPAAARTERPPHTPGPPHYPGNIGVPGGEKPRPGARDWPWALALLAAVLLAYQPAWNGKPLWDDQAHHLGPALQSWKGLEEIWFHPGATQQFYPLAY